MEAGEGKVIAAWTDGKPAVTERSLGKGKCIASGTLPGMAYYRSIRIEPDVTESANREDEIEDTQSYLEAMSAMVGLRPTATPEVVEEEEDMVEEPEDFVEEPEEFVGEPAYAVEEDDDF